MAVKEIARPQKSLIDLGSASIVFVTDSKNSASSAYRIENLTIRLSALGESVRVISEQELESLTSLPNNVKVLYLLRCSMDLSVVDTLIGQQGHRKALLIYDVDDVIFDPEVYNPKFVSALRKTTKAHREFLTGVKLKASRALIHSADHVVVSTVGIANFARAINTNIRVVGNSPLPWMNALPLKTRSEGKLKLVYASGSDSHDADFRSVWETVKEALLRDREVELYLLGHSPIRKREVPKSIRNQVVFRAPVEHSALIQELARYDVNLAPIELDNPFVAGKSNLKAQHAALAGIPTIATRFGEFETTIESGSDGLLAGTQEEWSLALSSIKDANYRAQLAREAQVRILMGRQSAETTRHAEWLRLRAQEFDSPKNNRPEKNQHIVWVLDGLPSFSGGHRNILRVAALKRDGLSQTLLVLNSDASNEDLQALARRYYGYSDISITSNEKVMDAADFVVATHHSTVNFAMSHSPSTAGLNYFVQDLEALFYPVGDDYVRALRSLLHGQFKVICSGPWIADRLQTLLNVRSEHFEFPVDRDIYAAPDRFGISRQGVIFFLKPGSSRRLFELSIETIRALKELAPNIPISTFGDSRKISDEDLAPLKQMGKPVSLSDLAELYSANKIGVVFSPTNPSLIPYEMMACGLVLVDCGLPGVTPGVSSTTYGIEALPPEPFEIAKRIISTYFDEELLKKLQKFGFEEVDRHPSEYEMASQVISFVLES